MINKQRKPGLIPCTELTEEEFAELRAKSIAGMRESKRAWWEQVIDAYLAGPSDVRFRRWRAYQYVRGCKEESAKCNATRLWRDPSFRWLLSERQEELKRKTEVNAEYILQEAIEQYRRLIGEVAIPEEKLIELDDGEYAVVEVESRQYLPQQALRALELAGRNVLVQAFQDNVKTEVIDSTEILRERQRKAEQRAAELRKRREANPDSDETPDD